MEKYTQQARCYAVIQMWSLLNSISYEVGFAFIQGIGLDYAHYEWKTGPF